MFNSRKKSAIKIVIINKQFFTENILFKCYNRLKMYDIKMVFLIIFTFDRISRFYCIFLFAQFSSKKYVSCIPFISIMNKNQQTFNFNIFFQIQIILDCEF